MITLDFIKSLADGDGATLKGFEPIRYKTGWQVATEGIETRDASEALAAINSYAGNCGLWFENGIYYVDKSHRENTKRQALETGKKFNQISIYGWQRGKLAYC